MKESNTSIPAISVVIPAYNEERRLPPTLVDMVDYFNERKIPFEIIVVNDSSTDDTSTVVRKIAKLSPAVRLVEHSPNRGKGFSVKSGVLQSRGELILMADADGATPIAEIARLERAIAAGADLAIASRAIQSDETNIDTSIHRRLMGRIFNTIANLLVVPGIADTQCGFKLFKRRAGYFLFSKLKSERFSFDVELLYMAKRANMKIAEVAVNWENIPESKINLLTDSTQMFIDLFRFRWWHKDVTPSTWEKYQES